MGSPFETAAGGSGIPLGRTGLNGFGFAATQRSAHRIVAKNAVQSRERLMMGSSLAAGFSGTQALELG
jgi:hypothetical protein